MPRILTFVVLLLFVLACESVDKVALVDAVVEATEKLDSIEADRDAVGEELLDVWEQVEAGPQMVALAMERVAQDYESRSQTIQASRTRDKYEADFAAHPLVQEATRLSEKYDALDNLWRQANRELGDALIAVQDAGADDLYRERLAAR